MWLVLSRPFFHVGLSQLLCGVSIVFFVLCLYSPRRLDLTPDSVGDGSMDVCGGLDGDFIDDSLDQRILLVEQL